MKCVDPEFYDRERSSRHPGHKVYSSTHGKSNDILNSICHWGVLDKFDMGGNKYSWVRPHIKVSQVNIYKIDFFSRFDSLAFLSTEICCQM